MKKYLVSGLISLASVAAFAGVDLDIRADYKNLADYDDALGGTKDGENLFDFNRAKLIGSSKVSDDLVLKSRIDLRKAKKSDDKDSTSEFIEFAYAAHTLSEMFTVEAGKLDISVGGVELDYSAGDRYFTSLAADNQNEYMVGVNFVAKLAPGHTVSLLGANGMQEDKKGDMAVGLLYKGSVMEKVKLIASYVSLKKDLDYEFDYNLDEDTSDADESSITTTDVETTWLAVGAQVKLTETLTWDIDYLANTYVEAVGTDDIEETSIVTQFTYAMDNAKVSAKAESSKFDTGTKATTYDLMNYGIAVEYKPIADKDFRYHLAFTSSSQEYEHSALKSIEQQEIVLGFKLKTSLLQ